MTGRLHGARSQPPVRSRSCSSSIRCRAASTEVLPSADAARHLAQYGLQQQDTEKLPRIALGLRLIGGSEAISFLQQPRQNSDEENRAQILLEQIGGHQALNVLVDRRIKALNQAQGRVKEFDEQAFEEAKELTLRKLKVLEDEGWI